MKNLFKKTFFIVLAVFLVGCQSKGFNPDSKITVISREDGSGTKSAFTSLFKIYSENDKVENTTIDAEIIQSTGAILGNVSSNKYAIGYVSFGVLNKDIKTLKIDNVEITKENIKNGTYKISRKFNIVVNKENSNQVKDDFINFILSKQGQEVVEKAKYIPLDANDNFSSSYPTGKLTIAGSSSVAPVVEKLKEIYLKINKNATIEINQSDSTSGVENTVSKVSDIGLVSRELTDKEKSSNIEYQPIAIDALAIIINKENPVVNLSTEEIKEIYQGKKIKWKDLKGD